MAIKIPPSGSVYAAEEENVTGIKKVEKNRKILLTKGSWSGIISIVPLRAERSKAREQMQMWRNWQTRYFEVVVSFARVGSSPVICTICGYGGIGRRARFRF